jgi:hypothetical protein
LREVGGWDAWNVTKDADLGLRLARFGYRSVTFDGAGPPRPSSQGLGSRSNTVLLGLPVDRRVARAVAVLARSLSLGEDRARPHAEPHIDRDAARAGNASDEAAARI